jgi:hypothetical protein
MICRLCGEHMGFEFLKLDPQDAVVGFITCVCGYWNLLKREFMRFTRITIEVGGYRWKVHGNKTGLMWHTHLVELLGAERLDVPLDQGLRQKIREAVAKHLGLEVADVRPITEDLVLI